MRLTSLKQLSHVALIILTWQTISCAEGDQMDLARYFGRQDGPRKSTKKIKIEGNPHMELSIIKGTEIVIPDGTNLVMLRDKEIVRVSREELGTKPNLLYLVGEIRFPETGRRAVYTCDALITSGPLKGVIVHMRDGLFPCEDNSADINKDLPMVARRLMCVYELSSKMKDLLSDEDEIQFEIVKLLMK